MSDLRGVGAVGDGRYRLERVLGSGGMAVVALGTDRELGRPVAVKILAEHLSHDEPFRQRFTREARMAARLGHPNVVQVFDVGQERGRQYIVMEYVAGRTLQDLLRERGSLSADETVSIALQVCAGLEHAHAAGVIHRDVNPCNLLLRTDGQVKIADFGIARELDGTRLTQTGLVMGTVGYLAPELATGEHPVSAAADLYSLGTVMYILLTGRNPFAATSPIELVMKQQQGSVTPPSEVAAGVPPRLDAIVLRCLDPDPRRRPISAAALANDLATPAAEPTTEPVPGATVVRATVTGPTHDGSTRPITVPAMKAATRRLSARAWALVLAVLLAAGFVAGFVLSWEPASTPSPAGEALSPDERAIREARDLAAWISRNAG
jgi:serine/threonine protein kinase